jgi:hypothetical protein
LMGGQQSLRGLELVIHRPKCPFTPVVHSAFRLVIWFWILKLPFVYFGIVIYILLAN